MRVRHLALTVATAACLVLASWRLSAADAQLPLPTGGGTAALTIQALMALRRGDADPLSQLPLSAFTAANAIPDAGDAEVQRRWTAALPGILAGLDGAVRARALAALDRLYGLGAADVPAGPQRLRLAADFLPAPAALRELSAGADRAFDQGAFADFLAMAQLLEAAGSPAVMSQRRQQVALALSGQGTEVDAELSLAPPGPPRESATRPLPERPRLAIAWRTVPGWLLACDPWEGIVWQHRIDQLATVVAGAGAALVHDSAGLRALTDGGARIALGPVPAGARALAFAGGAAWFATGTCAWRLDLGTRRLQALELGGKALSPPLVRGERSLWLTAQDLLLFEGDRLRARLRHGLPAEQGWRLGSLRSQALMFAADGRSWRLAALDEQLALASPAERARLLIQASRFQEAVSALAGTAEAGTPAGRTLLLHAHLSLGPAHALAAMDELLALAQDAQEEIVMRQAALLGASTASPADALRARALSERIAALARANPEALFLPQTLTPGPLPDLGAAPAEWPSGLSGTGYALALEDLGGPAAGPGRRLVAVAEPAPPPLDQYTESRLPDGTTRYRQRQLRLAARIEHKEVRCADDRGRLLWWHRWAGLSLLEAPSTSLMCRGDAVVVVEGQQRMHVISLLTGTQLAESDLDDRLASLGDVAVIGRDRLALIGPLGVNTRLVLTGAAAAAIELPVPARWLVGVDGQAWVALQDGRVLAYPGGIAVALPAALSTSLSAPTVIADGLVVGDRLYPWVAP
jgi:hypothetical protein